MASRLGKAARHLPTARRHWRTLARAAAALAAARLTLRLLPFRRAIRFGCGPLGNSSERTDPTELLWAIEAVARRVPFRAKCIEQGMAAQRLLRADGIDARLHYGIRNEGAGLKAHVWLTVDGAIVLGGADAARFTEVAVFAE